MGSDHNTDLKGLETSQMPWTNIGTIDSTAAAADEALGVAERDFTSANALANTVSYLVPAETNAVEARFLLTTNDADVDIDVWVMRQGDTEMCRVCTLDVICGQQDATGSLHYADTINVTNGQWLSSINTAVPGTDHMARLMFDMAGYDAILFHGYGTFDEDCQVELSGY